MDLSLLSVWRLREKNKVTGTVTKTSYSQTIGHTWSLKYHLNAPDENKRHWQWTGFQQLDCFVCTQNKADTLKLLPSPIRGKSLCTTQARNSVETHRVLQSLWDAGLSGQAAAYMSNLRMTRLFWRWRQSSRAPVQGHWTDVLLGQHYKLQTMVSLATYHWCCLKKK